MSETQVIIRKIWCVRDTQNNKEDICVRDTSDDKKIYVSKIHRIIMKMYIGAQENLHNQQEKTHKFICTQRVVPVGE